MMTKKLRFPMLLLALWLIAAALLPQSYAASGTHRVEVQSSGFSDSLDTIAEMEPEARITEGLSLGSSEAEDCSDTVSGWLGSIGLAE